MQPASLPSTGSDAPASPPALAAFFARAGAFGAGAGVPESALSKRLFGASNRIEQIRAGSDIGVRRLAQAEADLTKMAADLGIDLPLDAGAGESDHAPERPRAGREKGEAA